MSKVFQGKRSVAALVDVDLCIRRGEMVSIVGPSGSGKSTLLNLIGGLDKASAGEIEIDGRCLSGLSDDELTRLRRDKIGFIFQFFNLLPTLTCAENVALPLHLRGWAKKKIEERVRELLGLVGLEARREHLPDELSGGERQRCAIARALSVYPPVLLADEPTGNLDTHTGAEILALIRDLHERLGSTVLIVTHDLHVAEGCARLVALRDGRIEEDRPGARAEGRGSALAGDRAGALAEDRAGALGADRAGDGAENLAGERAEKRSGALAHPPTPIHDPAETH